MLILIIIVLTRQPTVPLWTSAHTKLTEAMIKEMKGLARQALGVKETEETQETQEINTNTITPVSITTVHTQTEEEENNNNISVTTQTEAEETTNSTSSTQTETEEASLGWLLDKSEERLGEKISQVRTDLLAQILPLLQNIQQEMKELQQDSGSLMSPAPSLPLSPVLVSPEKHGDQSSHSLN